ncbi:VC0807 family protein [Kitasatospora sp. NPDC097643]|uniref:VC0807 family protein n=1 Tax=Kitasatospora sp. NPDC097643 TaxID=3157230 RepID=UPI00333207F2
MSQHANSTTRQPGRAVRLLLDWGPTLLFNVLAPVLTYNALSGHGVADATALLISSAWPLADLGVYFLLHRRLDEFGVFTLVTLALGALSAVAYNTTELIFIKDSALTGLIGLGFLATLLAKRPAMFYFGRKFASGGTPEGIERWNGLWQYEGFRRGQRLLTVIWGVAFLVESVLRIALTYVLSTSAMVTVSSVLPWAVLGGLIFFTVSWGRRRAARMQAALGAEAVGAPSAERPTVAV